MLLNLQQDIIYGPVKSRRLGRSLGLNILPVDFKMCSFNCLYCQYGWTDCDKVKKSQKKNLPSPEKIKDRLKKTLVQLKDKPQYITFSGNGEPTLHPEFPEIVDIVIKLRDNFSPASKTAILSNSSRVTIKNIRKAISKLDTRIMKLDVGNNGFLKTYNLPCEKTSINKITEGLATLDNVIIQSLFTSGPLGNYKQDNIKEWIKRLKIILPILVQIYTLDRGFPSKKIKATTKNKLLKIKEKLEKQNIKAKVF